jgi:ribonucleoside-diphosphate reductase alpha chain
MNSSFAPSGITDDPDIRTASSITDYIFRRLAIDYLSFDNRLELGLASIEDMPESQQTLLTDDQTVDGRLVGSIAEPETTEEITIVDERHIESETPKPADKVVHVDSSAPLCYNCGNQTQRAGSCYVCGSCGSTTGCS